MLVKEIILYYDSMSKKHKKQLISSSKIFFFSENHALYDIMRKNTVKPDSLQMII